MMELFQALANYPDNLAILFCRHFLLME